ncbi:hypothetical protein WDV86_01900 [Pseudokineococcus sp. 1T1Z-3]
MVLAAVVVAAAGCSDDSSEPTSAPSAQPAPTPTGTPLDFDLPEDDRETYPEWDRASREEAVTAGDAVMRAFVRPDQTAETSVIEAEWWETLAPLLTSEAQDAYFYVDPAEVPATAVTGPAALVEPESGTTAFLATVQVPTDVGTYDVLLARTGGEAPWLAERISPPESLSAPPSEPPSTTAPA